MYIAILNWRVLSRSIRNYAKRRVQGFLQQYWTWVKTENITYPKTLVHFSECSCKAHEQLLWRPRDNETLLKPNAVQSNFRQNYLTYFSKLKKKKKPNWRYFCTKIITVSKNYPPHSSFSHIGVLYLNWKLKDPSHCLNYFPNLTWNHSPYSH